MTPLDHPAVAVAARALEADIRQGARLPSARRLDPGGRGAGPPAGPASVMVGFASPNGNFHAPNEWMPLANLRGGMDAIARLWRELGAVRRGRAARAVPSAGRDPTIPGWRSAPPADWSAWRPTRCDAGPIPAGSRATMTPGGHRRFLRSALEAMINAPRRHRYGVDRLTGSAGTISGEVHRRMAAQRATPAALAGAADRRAAGRLPPLGPAHLQPGARVRGGGQAGGAHAPAGRGGEDGRPLRRRGVAGGPLAGGGGRGVPLLSVAGAGGDRWRTCVAGRRRSTDLTTAVPRGERRRSTRCWSRWSARTAEGHRPR